MNLESPQVNVEKSAEYLFNALSDVNNYKVLMPDTIAKFEVIDDSSFIFGLKGMPEIKLKLVEQVATSKIVLGSTSDKLPFSLTIAIDSLTENTAAVKLDFEGEFNAMMAMMIKGPISKFIETLAQNMVKL